VDFLHGHILGGTGAEPGCRKPKESIPMKASFVLLIASVCSLTAADMTVGTLYDSPLKSIESEAVSLAKAMPEAAFSFAPTQGAFEKARTFGGQVKHMASVIYMCAAAIKQEAIPVDLGGGEEGPASVKTKAEIIKFLQDAFAYGHGAMATITAANQLDMVKSPFNGPDMARGVIASLPVWHSFDHYGQMAVYARMNNVIPPASMPAPPPSDAKKK
jgi:hypothetical protein